MSDIDLKIRDAIYEAIDIHKAANLAVLEEVDLVIRPIVRSSINWTIHGKIEDEEWL